MAGTMTSALPQSPASPKDMMAWECDYSHSDSRWPNSPESVQVAVRGPSDGQTDEIRYVKAMRLLSLDPCSIRRRQGCTAGALRRETAGHDVSIVARDTRLDKKTALGDFLIPARP